MGPITRLSFRKGRWKRRVIFSLTLSALVAAGAGPQEEGLEALPSGKWVRLGEPCRDVPAGMLAYSGMAVDPRGRRLLLFGGGHNDYWGNEVWAWEIPARAWKKLTEPTPRDEYASAPFDWDRSPGMFPHLKLPVSRHTYDSVEFAEHAGVLYAAGSSTYSGGGETLWKAGEGYTRGASGPRRGKGWGPFDAWLFDPRTLRWTYVRPETAAGWGGNICAYAPDLRRVIVMGSDSSGFWGPFTYDPGTGAWADLKPKGRPATGIHQTATYDSRRKVCYLVGGSSAGDALWAYRFETHEWAALDPAGRRPRLRDGTGSAYDASADVLVTYGKDGLWVYDPAANAWQENPARGGPEPPRKGDTGSSAEIYGRLKYDPVGRVVFLVIGGHGPGVEVWGYRHGIR